ncbi:MAG: ABC-three component system middle component 4 [Pseudomonas sp.]|uniref:ABC-three component system middle component 4 n=1 Tax=Pseudomonas sp. TaxID=306 RepID=UPI003BB7A937
MTDHLPFISIDEELSLNLSILIIIILKLSRSSKNNLTLDLSKLQVFMYLIKNPSRINFILLQAGKKYVAISSQQTYTIESQSTNVDILFDRRKIKLLIKKLALYGFVNAKQQTDNTLKYYLTENGEIFSKTLTGNYFNTIHELTQSIEPLQSQTNSKLHSYLNIFFKGN